MVVDVLKNFLRITSVTINMIMHNTATPERRLAVSDITLNINAGMPFLLFMPYTHTLAPAPTIHFHGSLGPGVEGLPPGG